MVYSDVVKNNKILPCKKQYTKRDFDKLIEAGTAPKEARFICVCSAIYHDTKYSSFFDSFKCKLLCNLI